eukprot:scaffold27439_cov34-Tisochrysis_lutea.AAC.4
MSTFPMRHSSALGRHVVGAVVHVQIPAWRAICIIENTVHWSKSDETKEPPVGRFRKRIGIIAAGVGFSTVRTKLDRISKRRSRFASRNALSSKGRSPWTEWRH